MSQGEPVERLSPRLVQILDHQPTLVDRALVLLSRVEPHSLAELVELLGCSRLELMGSMAELQGRELVKHVRREGEPTLRWYATAKGRALGSELLAKADKELPQPESPVDARPDIEPLEGPAATEAKRPLRGRRVVISEREQRQERSFTFDS